MDIDSIIGIISLIIAVLGSFTRKTLGKLLCALVAIVFCGQIFIAIDKNWSSILLFLASISLLLLFTFFIMKVSRQHNEILNFTIKDMQSSEGLFLVTLFTPLLTYIFSLIFSIHLPQEIDFASYISYISTQKISWQFYLYLIQNLQITIFYILRCFTLTVSILSIYYSFLKLNNSRNLNFSERKNLLLITLCIITAMLVSSNLVYQILYENFFPLF